MKLTFKMPEEAVERILANKAEFIALAAANGFEILDIQASFEEKETPETD